MKYSQIRMMVSEYAVNEWLKRNQQIEIVSISIAATDTTNWYLIHYKIEE